MYTTHDKHGDVPHRSLFKKGEWPDSLPLLTPTGSSQFLSQVILFRGEVVNDWARQENKGPNVIPLTYDVYSYAPPWVSRDFDLHCFLMILPLPCPASSLLLFWTLLPNKLSVLLTVSVSASWSQNSAAIVKV